MSNGSSDHGLWSRTDPISELTTKRAANATKAIAAAFAARRVNRVAASASGCVEDPAVRNMSRMVRRPSVGVASPGMTPLGIGIVGTGNIAGGYARDALTHSGIRLVAATDLDPERAVTFGEAHGCRAHASLDDLLEDDAVDIVVNLTSHHAHYEVTRRALEAGRHVYSEKPLALDSREARELVGLAAARGLRLGCSPSTFLGEAQQTAAAWIQSGRLGLVRAIYAEVNWGRIETWHPAPASFYEVGALVDVGVYPLTLVTTMVGPARSVRAWGWGLKPERTTIDGIAFRIASPDLIVAAIELDGGAVVRLTASFYVGRPARLTGSLEFHGDDASLALGSFQEFDATVEVGAYGQSYAPIAHVRPPFHGIAWARGVAEMADAIAEGRPHRASGEQAAHVVDILEAAAVSMADGGRRIEISSTFAAPLLMPWAKETVGH
jgi:predicted dehydrogenase